MPTSLGAYVRARAADADGRVGAAAAGYAVALAQAPGDPVIAMRAYRQALAAGDIALAVRAAAVLVTAEAAPADVSVLLFAAALKARDLESAGSAAEAMAQGPLAFLAPVLKAWLAFERRQGDAAALLAGDAGGMLARRFNAENRALLLLAAGQRDEGLAALRALLVTDGGSSDLRINAAALLACNGGRDVARALLAGIETPRERCAKPSAAFGAGRLFSRLAGELAAGEARPLAIALTRAALMLDNRDDRARLALAEALSRDGANAEALATLDATSPSDATRSARVGVLARAGQASAALAAARAESSAQNATEADAQRLGDLLVAEGRFDDAAAAYATAIARAGATPGWLLYLQQGGALEQAGKWREALPLLQRALALAPDEPVALNYVGYAQVDRGENVAAARQLIERAAKLRPDDAAITDSLGWAWFRSGEIARALPLLERAARERPSSAVVNEHLGDAYWAAGRRYEARYAWRAAAISAAGDEAVRIADKVAKGLGAAR